MLTENHVKTVSPLLIIFSGLFGGVLLISNILANHMLVLWRFTVDAGTITFPLVYILSDVIQEVYGYKAVRRTAYIALAANALMALLIKLVVLLPQPEWYDGTYFEMALNNSWRIVAASLIALWLGDLADNRVFRHMKKANPGSMTGFMKRALTSSLVGHVVDTNLFVIIAFLFVIPLNELPGMILVGICLKWAYEWCILPVTVRLIKWANKKEELYADIT
jgi:hypothetical protein